MLFKKFCTGLIIGLTKDLFGLLNSQYNSQYINISTYRPLSGSSYIKLTAELRSSKEGLTIKNVFYGVMLGMLIL